MTDSETTHVYLIPAVPGEISEDWFVTKLVERIRIDVCNAVHKQNRLNLLQMERMDGAEVTWIAKSGLAKMGFKRESRGLKVVIAPDLNVIASLDFGSLYRSCLNEQGDLAPSSQGLGAYASSHPSFIMQAMGESVVHAAIIEQLYLYQRCADELAQVVYHAAYYLEHSVQKIDANGSLNSACQGKYLNTLYVQVDERALQALQEQEDVDAALLALANRSPFASTIAESLMGFNFSRATIEGRLITQGFKLEVTGRLRIWRKEGLNSVVSCYISCHTGHQLHLVQNAAVMAGVAIARKELPPWFTIEADHSAVHCMVTHLPVDVMRNFQNSAGRKITGIAGQYQYPQGCDAILFTVDECPKNPCALYTPLLLGRTIQSAAFTIQLFSDFVVMDDANPAQGVVEAAQKLMEETE